tara:strand:- start:17 stop:352 length:336 start_codon:yes stop_codon:yes gene_type:complete
MDIKKADLDAANAKLKALVLKILKTKKGGNKNKTIKADTGKLKRNLDAFVVVKKDGIYVNVDVVDYYKFLDQGSKTIKKPWFLTKEFTESKEFKQIITNLLTKHYVNKILN